MLAHRELKVIQDGHRRNDDMMMLLREVKRLRDLAAASYGVLGFMPLTDQAEEVKAAAGELCERLRLEPAVQAYLIARRKHEDMEFKRRIAASTASPAGPSSPHRS